MDKKVTVITTGGTIDKHYNPVSGNLDIGLPAVRRILSAIGVDADYLHLMRKDSLDMTDSDRIVIADAVDRCNGPVIVTHGTDTMEESAAVVAKTCRANKAVVFVGAMVPHAFPESDAVFNVGFAMGQIGYLPPGVYIAMHGQVRPYFKYKKNRSRGCFEALT